MRARTDGLSDQMIAGDIDTDPDYQRGVPIPAFPCSEYPHSLIDVVWPEHKQMGTS